MNSVQEKAYIGLILDSLEEFCILKPKIDLGVYEYEDYARILKVETNLIRVLNKKIPWTKDFFELALEEKDYDKCLELIKEKRASL